MTIREYGWSFFYKDVKWVIGVASSNWVDLYAQKSTPYDYLGILLGGDNVFGIIDNKVGKGQAFKMDLYVFSDALDQKFLRVLKNETLVKASNP